MEPGCRFGIALVAKEKRGVLESDHFLHSRYFWNGDDSFVFAVQAEAANLRWTTKQITDSPVGTISTALLNSGVSSGRRRTFPRGAALRERRYSALSRPR